jgi:predicted nucleotidyltransferase
MLNSKYLKRITAIIAGTVSGKIKVFVFGSSLRKEKFGDVDIGIMGEIERSSISKLKEEFENSTLPFNIDVIDFNSVSKTFAENVFNQKVLWIKH